MTVDVRVLFASQAGRITPVTACLAETKTEHFRQIRSDLISLDIDTAEAIIEVPYPDGQTADGHLPERQNGQVNIRVLFVAGIPVGTAQHTISDSPVSDVAVDGSKIDGLFNQRLKVVT